MDAVNYNKYLTFLNKYPQGTIFTVKVKKIVEFGIIVSFLDNSFNNLEGLIFLHDISWSNNYHEEIKNYKINDEIEVKILNIDVKKEKTFLGIKQLERDPFEEYIRKVNLGDKIIVVAVKIEDKCILVEVADSNVLFIEQEYLPENKKINPGDKLEAEVLSIENYNLILSLK